MSEGMGFVLAAYGIAFGVLAVWLWMMAAKVERIARKVERGE